jgi:type IV pilus assembly protein PilE
MRNKKTSEAGFTLIELMVVTVIIGIISLFAYSTYSKSVQKSRRAEGKAMLLEAAALQERRIADSGTYATDMTNLGYAANPAISDNAIYSVSASNTNGFTLTATAIGRQAVDTQCATMSLNALGQKSSTTSSDCW